MNGTGGKREPSWKGPFLAISPGLFAPALPSRLYQYSDSTSGNFLANPGQPLTPGSRGGQAACCACLSPPGQKNHNTTTLLLMRLRGLETLAAH